MLKIWDTGRDIDLIKYGLEIDGERLLNPDIMVLKDDETFSEEALYTVSIHELTLVDRLSSLPLHEILPIDNSIELDFNIDHLFSNAPFSLSAIFTLTRAVDKNFYSYISVRPLLDDWKKPWSVIEFRTELKEIAGDKVTLSKNNEYVFFPSFSFRSSALSPLRPLESIVGDESRIVLDTIARVESSLTAKMRSNAVTAVFDFPEEIRVYCEQYLLYFVQFLKDLGVEANAEVQHSANQVLFSVTPVDGTQALEKIRKALDIYLQLPTNIGAGNYVVADSEIEVVRLNANIQHLNSQISLARAQMMAAQAAIDYKDATIEQKNMTIRVLEGEVFALSMRSPDQEQGDKDTEDLLGGAVSLKPYEAKGVDVNLPFIFRKLRKYFKEKDNGE